MTANPAFAPLRGTGCRLFSGTRYKRAQANDPEIGMDFIAYYSVNKNLSETVNRAP